MTEIARRGFQKKDIFKNFSEFTKKQLCQSLLLQNIYKTLNFMEDEEVNECVRNQPCLYDKFDDF